MRQGSAQTGTPQHDYLVYPSPAGQGGAGHETREGVDAKKHAEDPFVPPEADPRTGPPEKRDAGSDASLTPEPDRSPPNGDTRPKK